MASTHSASPAAVHSPASRSPGAAPPAAERPFVLVHLSDPHFTAGERIRPAELLNKRLYGRLRWKLRRRGEHDFGILDRLRAELDRIRPDHVAVTGDLTHLGLPAECAAALEWLRTLGPPEGVTVVPGNHDTYVRENRRPTIDRWRDYLRTEGDGPPVPADGGWKAHFPVVRLRGRIAVIGLSTAHTSPLFLATGSSGTRQLQRLDTVLERMGGGAFFRVLVMHHPPLPGVVGRRKRLTDAAALLRILRARGVELVLHGHAHKASHHTLKTRFGATPVMGAPAISSLGRTDDRRARVYRHDIHATDGGWEIVTRERVYSPASRRFVAGKTTVHAPPRQR